MTVFLNTILLGGPVRGKLEAAAAAGFDAVELWREDVAACPGGAAEVRAMAADLGLEIADIMVLRDATGLPDGLREAKRDETLAVMDLALALGTACVQSPATMRAECIAERIDDDLAWMADQAARRGLVISYEATAWSAVDNTLPAAWDRVRRLGAANVGVVVDSFHICARGRDARDLDGVPAEKIFQVQLNDLIEPVGIGDLPHLIEVARHRRLLPGEGRFPLGDFVRRLSAMGYAGPMGVEVFSDVLKAQPPARVAEAARASFDRLAAGGQSSSASSS